MMMKAKDRIIFALDVPGFSAAQRYVEMLSDCVGMFKVGLELFTRSGPEVIRLIRKSGPAQVFLDLKLHDIPATVHRAMQQIADLGVAFTTVHCAETSRMLDAAVQGGAGKVAVLGVTVLTSVTGDDIQNAGYRKEFSTDMTRLVLKKAEMAKQSGCAGVICSGLEAAMIKQTCGMEFLTVTPGVRPLWASAGSDDQRRITTPSQAIEAGADYLVVGRPIRAATDPRTAALRIAAEIEASCVS